MPTFKINSIDYTIADGVYTATCIHWSVSLTREGVTVGSYGTCGLPAPSATFIDWDDLAEDTVLNWLTDTLGEQVEGIKAGLETKLAEKLAPVRGSGLPW